MSVAPRFNSARYWLLPTCGESCGPGNHDPHWHEAHGLVLAMMASRVRQAAPSVLRTGPLTVDFAQEHAYVHGERVSLSEREWGVLAYYARNAGRPCAHEDVLACVWGPEYVTKKAKRRPGRSGSWRTDIQILTVNVNRLRAKLGAASDLLERSERGKRRLRSVEPTS